MRVTDKMALDAAIVGQRRTVQQLDAATRTASSGLRVRAPSDDPVAWSMKVRHDAQIQRMENRSQTLLRVAGDMDLAEASLSSAGEILEQARGLAVQAANGTLDAQSRASIGVQVTSLRASLLNLANARGTGGYLFGGTATDTAPFTSTGVFVGNDTPTQVEVADGATSRSNASGAMAFTVVGGRDVLSDLAAFVTALTGNNVAGIQAAVGTMELAHRQIVTAQVTTGLGSERLRSAGDVTGTALTMLHSARASETEADAFQALSTLSSARSGYERSIAVTRELLQVSAVSR